MASGDTILKYPGSSALTISLASGPLASDTNLLAGRQSTVVDNSTNGYDDYILGGKVTTGTSPTTGKVIEIWVFPIIDDTPTYPDAFGASDANVTATTRNILFACAKQAVVIGTNSTSNQAYGFSGISVAGLFGGTVPKKFGVFVVHNTGVALNSTAGNQLVTSEPVYFNTSP